MQEITGRPAGETYSVGPITGFTATQKLDNIFGVCTRGANLIGLNKHCLWIRCLALLYTSMFPMWAQCCWVCRWGQCWEAPSETFLFQLIPVLRIDSFYCRILSSVWVLASSPQPDHVWFHIDLYWCSLFFVMFMESLKCS